MNRHFVYQLIVCFLRLSTKIVTGLNKDHHRRARSVGDNMNFGQGPAGGVQGYKVMELTDGLSNPQREQLESIYRGKVMWGGNATNVQKDEEVVYGKGYDPDVETDKFGNPLNPPKPGPRPKVNPKRKEDVNEGGRGRRALEDTTKYEIKLDALNSQQKVQLKEMDDKYPEIEKLIDNNMDKSVDTLIKKAQEQKLIRKRSIRSERKENLIEDSFEQSPFEGQFNESPLKQSHNLHKRSVDGHNNLIEKPVIIDHLELDENTGHVIQKRDVSPGYISQYKGPKLESRYKGPVIMSQYKGPQILSQYKGPQIRAQYEGPQLISEYKGKVVGMLGGVEQYKAMANAAQTSTKVVNNAQMYDKMNREAAQAQGRVMRFVRHKPKLAAVFNS